ncbi:MAG: orotidine-5'-phosphate decarboxylase [Bacteroidota bacterium]
MTRTELIHLIRERRSFLCIGLDPEIARMPAHLRDTPDGILEFCQAIVDATRDLCVAYKPNTAFFEQYGSKGWECLERLVAYIGKDHLVIADAKRGDIGNTSTMYAKAFFEALGADAVTVAPYMGKDSVAPFLAFEGRWAVVLALTSNEGSRDFQLQSLTETDSKSKVLFEEVLTKVSEWGSAENTMFVVGATHPEMFRRVRKIVPDHFLLVPGVGAQGGSLDDVARNGMSKDVGLLVNSSRQILYAGSGLDFHVHSRIEAEKLQRQMAELLETII